MELVVVRLGGEAEGFSCKLPGADSNAEKPHLVEVDGFCHPERIGVSSRKFETKTLRLTSQTDYIKLHQLLVVVPEEGFSPGFFLKTIATNL